MPGVVSGGGGGGGSGGGILPIFRSPRRLRGGSVAIGPLIRIPSVGPRTPWVATVRPVASPRRLPRGTAAIVGRLPPPDPPSVVIRASAVVWPLGSPRRPPAGSVRVGVFGPLPVSSQVETPLVWLIRPVSRPTDRRLGWFPGFGRLEGVGPQYHDPPPRVTRGLLSRRSGEDLARRRRGEAWSSSSPRYPGGVPIPLPFPDGLWFDVYGSDSVGQSIDYGAPLAQIRETTWTTGSLGPGTWGFGVRAANEVGEEQNLDCAIYIVIDGYGNDITNRPAPPEWWRAFATQGGGIRVEWSYPLVRGPKAPDGFRVYLGSPTVDRSVPAGAVPAAASVVGTYRLQLGGLSDGVSYQVAVRAYNSCGEDPGTTVRTVAADAAGPAAVESVAVVGIV